MVFRTFIICIFVVVFLRCVGATYGFLNLRITSFSSSPN